MKVSIWKHSLSVEFGIVKCVKILELCRGNEVSAGILKVFLMYFSAGFFLLLL